MGDFSIDYVENRPEVVPTVASWVWREWGFASLRDCASDLHRSDRGSIPSRFVAVSRGKAVGIVNLIECNLPPRCPSLRPWLAGLYVRPSYRRVGIGSALVRFCEMEAASLGFGRLYLYTEQAHAFYRRLGWVTIESVVWRSEEVAVMARELPLPTSVAGQRTRIAPHDE